MPINRRTFIASSVALGASRLVPLSVASAWAASDFREGSDPLFNQPYVDVDEWRDQPSRHRYVHGGFSGSAFRDAFPAKGAI